MATESSQLSEIDYLRKNYLLLQKVCREFDVAARQLDSTKDKIRVARVAGVGAATVGAVTAFATGGAGAVATVGDVASMVYALSGIVEDILNSQELKGLERNWSQVKKMYTSEFDIPRRNKDAIADWARGNLPRDQARAVIRAIEKCTSDLRSPERLKHLDSRNLKALLESPLLLVAADFSVFEILLAAAKEKDEPVDVQRFLQRLRKYQQILKQRFAERTAGRGSITGAQDIRGLWRIYPTTQAARNELLIKGMNVRNCTLQVSHTNPFILRDDSGTEEPSTKLWLAGHKRGDSVCAFSGNNTVQNMTGQDRDKQTNAQTNALMVVEAQSSIDTSAATHDSALHVPSVSKTDKDEHGTDKTKGKGGGGKQALSRGRKEQKTPVDRRQLTLSMSMQRVEHGRHRSTTPKRRLSGEKDRSPVDKFPRRDKTDSDNGEEQGEGEGWVEERIRKETRQREEEKRREEEDEEEEDEDEDRRREEEEEIQREEDRRREEEEDRRREEEEDRRREEEEEDDRRREEEEEEDRQREEDGEEETCVTQ
ncbi:uncharacterized protein [Littorina saxatilis]|uniref:uncharacterized protein n=1 Tax=Littorina saxatilis TaxID=31220 RepID=UPI0038B4E68F